MIVFCHLLNDNSGSPLILRMAIAALEEAGADCCLYVGSQGRGFLEGANIPTHKYWYRRSRFRIITLVTFLISQLALYRALRQANLPPDARIYVNTLLPFGAALWGYFNNRRVIYHAHEVSISPAPLRWLLVSIANLTAKSVLYVSRDQYQRLPVKRAQSIILPNPTPPEIVEQGSKSPYERRQGSVFEVLMISSPRDFKGIPEFLSLAQRFIENGAAHFTLVLNGDPDEIDRYIPLRDRPENVSVYARTDNPGQFYAKANVLLNLSRVDQWIETFGMTIVEGMSFSLPVVVPPIGGPSEIVTDGQEGFLVDSRNVEKLERLLLQMIGEPDLTLRLSKAASQRARDYTFERFAARLKLELLGSDANDSLTCCADAADEG